MKYCVPNVKEIAEMMLSGVSNIYQLTLTLAIVTGCTQNALETSFAYLVDIYPKLSTCSEDLN